MKKILIGILLALGVTSGVIYLMYNKPHRNPATETPIKVSATELFKSFESNETEANQLYLDKVLEVTGKITEVSSNQNGMPVLALETENIVFGVRCTMENGELITQVGETVTVKGICTGYLSDVIITNAIRVDDNN
ncbi:MAG: hypothetical protein ABL895_18175 [Cyclobacteriaceae bacterium]